MSRVTINVNDLSLIHEDSGGVSTATLPDVCVTPPNLAPVPYPNVARSRDLVNGSSFVRADGGRRIAIAGSAFGRSTGDEPGAGGGVASGVQGKEATWLSYSFDVSIEGRGACRHTDKMLHNRGNTLNCGGAINPKVPGSKGSQGGDSDKGHPPRRQKLPPWETPLRPSWFGVDTGSPNLKTDYAKKRHVKFVCRYLPGLVALATPPTTPTPDPQAPPPRPPLAPFSREDADRLSKAGLALVAIWEVTAAGDKDNSRAIQADSLEGQKKLGHHDGHLASHQIRDCGGRGKPIYFTVDFNTKIWNAPFKTDAITGLPITRGDLIIQYFEGIKDAIGVERTGVYGKRKTLEELFKRSLVRYGWQEAYTHAKPYPKAQLLQTTIYPDATRFGPDPRSSPAAAGTYVANMTNYWGPWGWNGTSTDGSQMDFDRAIMVDFGQWHPGK